MWENADTSTFLAQSVLIELSHGLIQFPWTKSCSRICHLSFQIHHNVDLSAFLYLPLTLLNFTSSCGEGPARGIGIYYDPKYFRLLRQPSPLLRTCKARRLLSISLSLPSAAKTSAPQCAVSSTRSPLVLATYLAHVHPCLRGMRCTPKM